MNRSNLVPVRMKKPPGLLTFPCVSWGCGSQHVVQVFQSQSNTWIQIYRLDLPTPTQQCYTVTGSTELQTSVGTVVLFLSHPPPAPDDKFLLVFTPNTFFVTYCPAQVVTVLGVETFYFQYYHILISANLYQNSPLFCSVFH